MNGRRREIGKVLKEEKRRRGRWEEERKRTQQAPER